MTSLSNLYLDAIVACAETGQLTKAAKKLHITQSALSQRIALLEDSLGVSLMARGRSGITLTPAGFRLLRYCLTKGDLEKEALSEIQGGSAHDFRGSVRLVGFSSIMSSIVIPSLVPLAAQHPDVGFELKTAELTDIPALLLQGMVDFAIADMPFEMPAVKSVFLGFEENVLVKKKAYKGPEVYLDHNESDSTTASYFRMQFAGVADLSKVLKSKKPNKVKNAVGKVNPENSTISEPQRHLKRRFLGDVSGLIAGVENGLGLAILPVHLVNKISGLEVVKSNRVLRIPVYLNVKDTLAHIPFYEKTIKILVEGFQKALNQN